MRGDRVLGFIGAGNMATALIAGIIKAGIARPEQIWTFDIKPEQTQKLRAKEHINIASSNIELMANSDVVVFAVKPQNMKAVLAELKGNSKTDQVFISIVAGTTAKFIEQGLGGKPRVVRVMPNTPALISCGATALAPGNYAKAEDVALAQTLFQAVGITTMVKEEQLDAVTGLSGSGPAYFFLLIEALIKAGQKVGLSEQQASKLVLQTAVGSAQMAGELGRSSRELREMVTSPGGTTEAGLKVLFAADFEGLIARTVETATACSRELGQ